MFGIQEHLIREVNGSKERSLGEEMDPVRSWVRNVGVVDANVAAQRYSTDTAGLLTESFHQLSPDVIATCHLPNFFLLHCNVCDRCPFKQELQATCCKTDTSPSS